MIQLPSLRAVPHTPADRARVRLRSPWPAWPSPQNGRVGIRNSSLEACSGFARATARSFACPPQVGVIQGFAAPVARSKIATLGLLPGCPISSPGETLTHVYARPLVAHSFAVGTPVTRRPPHRSQHAELPHWAPTLGRRATNDQPYAARSRFTLTRYRARCVFCGRHSPWPTPFPPSPPRAVGSDGARLGRLPLAVSGVSTFVPV